MRGHHIRASARRLEQTGSTESPLQDAITTGTIEALAGDEGLSVQARLEALHACRKQVLTLDPQETTHQARNALLVTLGLEISKLEGRVADAVGEPRALSPDDDPLVELDAPPDEDYFGADDPQALIGDDMQSRGSGWMLR